MIHRILPGVALFAALTSSGHATPFDGLAPGLPVPDNTVTMGRYTVRLPQGTWIVASRLAQRGGTQSGTSATPVQLVAALANVDRGSLAGMLLLRVPASTYANVRSWQDDPCKGFRNALLRDTLQQTFFMPECLAVETYAVGNLTTLGSGAFEDIPRWINSAAVQLPPRMLRIYYAKYHGGDFLHLFAYLPGDKQALPAIEVWSRSVASSLSAAVVDGQVGVIPDLPRSTAMEVKAPLPAVSLPVSRPNMPPAQEPPSHRGDASDRLRELKGLLDKGLITPADYEGKKQKILEEI